MRCIFATLLLTILVCSAAYGQNSNPQPSNTTGQGDSSSKQSQNSGDSSSQQSQQPSPPADSSSQPEKKQSAVKRKLKELVPSCANVGAYVKCKSSKSEKPKDSSEYAKDMDVGDFYLTEKKNYVGAMWRFRDALERKPNDPLATFKLAQALEGLKQNDEAREDYAAYLKLEPKGTYAGDAKQALERLQPQNADKAKEAPAPKDSHEL